MQDTQEKKVELSQVVKVYSGSSGCMCGCKGKYSYNEGKATQDYHVVNVRSVKIIFNKIMKNPDRIVDGDTIYVESNGRIQCMWLS